MFRILSLGCFIIYGFSALSELLGLVNAIFYEKGRPDNDGNEMSISKSIVISIGTLALTCHVINMLIMTW